MDVNYSSSISGKVDDHESLNTFDTASLKNDLVLLVECLSLFNKEVLRLLGFFILSPRCQNVRVGVSYFR